MSEVKVIGIGNDHAAVDLKNEIKAYLEEKGYKVVNYGTDSSESCDYPIYGAKVGHAVASGEVDAGVLICGTGIGISIAANKVKGLSRTVPRIPVSFPFSSPQKGDCPLGILHGLFFHVHPAIVFLPC